MKNENNYHFGDSELAQGIGIALVILAICLGFGGCIKLVISSDKESNIETSQQDIKNENNK